MDNPIPPDALLTQAELFEATHADGNPRVALDRLAADAASAKGYAAGLIHVNVSSDHEGFLRGYEAGRKSACLKVACHKCGYLGDEVEHDAACDGPGSQWLTGERVAMILLGRGIKREKRNPDYLENVALSKAIDAALDAKEARVD